MDTPLSQHNLTDEQLARALLKQAGLGLLDAARLALEFQHCSSSPRAPLDINDCISIIRRGSHECGLAEESPDFATAIEHFLESKRHRRWHTQQELRHYTKSFLRLNPDWGHHSLRDISSEACRQMLLSSFPNEHSRRKARVILHGLFSFCRKSGWVKTNPAAFMVECAPCERRIEPLKLHEVLSLLLACLNPAFLACAPAVGIMLWAGVRPVEVTRLCWEDINLREGIIILHPQHTKTGGARCVSLPPPLAWWLGTFNKGSGALCPRNWKRKWQALHQAAGLTPWVPDVLRHSFASYHAAHYHNFEQLQYEMGHRSLQLLRYRYLATGCITPQQAASFWNPVFWKRQLVRQP